MNSIKSANYPIDNCYVIGDLISYDNLKSIKIGVDYKLLILIFSILYQRKAINKLNQFNLCQ